MVLGVISLLVKPFSSGNISYVETESPWGIKTKVTLSDSSVVYLNAGSYLKYPSRFSGKKREVFLEGEAYFEVRKDVKHTFTVHAGSIDVVVFGTHFNIKAYNDENLIKATLAEGSVGIYKKQESNGTKHIKLVPNQQAIYDKKTGDISIEKVDAELSYAWKDGKYYFESETFAAIAKKLERNFNVNIKINSEQLKKEIFSGLFDKNKSVFQLLDAMKRHENFYYTVKNDTIMITKN
jgi:ferric-dicitrate binding protein FerR (iron transport regulator)